MLLGDDAPAIDPILDGPIAAAYDALVARPGPAVVVSDEVGLGIVPSMPNARRTAISSVSPINDLQRWPMRRICSWPGTRDAEGPR
jgi:hypothetical protein